ncbi:MAG: protein kinase [Myxococcaceae bacterium]|nr:protein kinase [Myxococcaceae bacterium]
MTRLAGKYELVRLLGRGGMAEVWEAVAHGEAGFRRRVAVKRVAMEHAGDERLAGLFVDEARVLSALHHPGVVAVIDFGVDAGVAFQVMELVDGADAGRLGAVSPPLALGIAARVGRALHAAHTAVDETGAPLNVVHRDVSPQNVLLSRRGEVKLSDFGIARWKHRTERTLAGASRGKPSYMAPEQATKGDVDARADVFSLGCTLHALCTGRSPLADENALVDLLAGVPLPLSPALVEPVRAVVARAVERDRNARFSSALGFAEACEAALERLVPAFGVEAAVASAVETLALPVPAMQVGDAPRADTAASRFLRSSPSSVASEREAELPRDASLTTQNGSPAQNDTPTQNGSPTQHGSPTKAAAASHLAAPTPNVALSLAPQSSGPLTDTPTFAPQRRLWPALLAVLTLTAGLGALALALSRPPEPVPADDDLAFEPLEGDRRAVVTRPVLVANPDPSTPPPRPAPSPAPQPRQPPRLGVIAVGGQRFVRGEVFVDGKSVGFAPRQLELPVGLHPVEVVLPDGQRAGPRVMSVGPQHTELAPLRWVED